MNPGRRAASAVVLALLGFVLTVNLRIQDAASSVVELRREQLVNAVRARQARTAELEKELAAVRAQLNASVTAGPGSTLRTLSEQTAALGAIAGAAPVAGPAAIVTVADAPEAESGDADFQIQDVDLQLIVNELWASGAEAIAINGQRIVGTTAIRNAGNAVLVNYRVLSSPYRVVAIGDADKVASIFESSQTGNRFETWRGAYGLGYKVERQKEALLAGYGGSIRLRYAEVVEGR